RSASPFEEARKFQPGSRPPSPDCSPLLTGGEQYRFLRKPIQVQKFARTPISIERGLLPCDVTAPKLPGVARLKPGLEKTLWLKMLVMTPENWRLVLSQILTFLWIPISIFQYGRPEIGPWRGRGLSSPRMAGRTGPP